MGLTCTVCSHVSSAEINKALISGQSNRSIAKQYGIDHNAVQRHRTNHLPEHLTKAKDAELVTCADGLIGDLQNLRQQALDFLDKAKAADDTRAAAPLITAACKVIETLAEVRGELDRKSVVNVFVNPEFQKVQQIILGELSDYPDVRQRIVTRLREVEG